MKKTPWFPADIKPVRIGVYEVENMYGSDLPVMLNYWNGKKWTGSASLVEGLSMDENPHGFAMQDRIWRGLQGDEHSLKVGASTYLVEFSEGPDRPYAED